MTEKVFQVVVNHLNRHPNQGIKCIALWDKKYDSGKAYNNPTGVILGERNISFKYLNPKKDHDFLKRYIAGTYIDDDYSTMNVDIDKIQKISFKSLVCDIV